MLVNRDIFRAEFTKFLDEICVKNNVECSHPRTAARLLDKVLLSSYMYAMSCTCMFLCSHRVWGNVE